MVARPTDRALVLRIEPAAQSRPEASIARAAMSPQELARRYQGGATLLELARETRRSPDKVRDLIREAGVSVRPRGRVAFLPPDEPCGASELRERQQEWKAASDKLLRAMLAYGVKHGLPNLSPVECRQRLRAL